MRIRRPRIQLTALPKRAEIVQQLLDRTRRRNYLEIGVQSGRCFLKIRASKKIGVDPGFLISRGRKLKYALRNPCNTRNVYARMTSDRFFDTHTRLLKRHPISVAFVDGLHTFEQSLRDVNNALRFLEEGGFVALHDCNPESAAAAAPARSIEDATEKHVAGWTGEWCGDVWKTIGHLRATRLDLDVCVLDCDYGVGIVRRRGDERPHPGFDDVEAMSYDTFDRNRRAILNLQPESYLAEILSARPARG